MLNAEGAAADGISLLVRVLFVASTEGELVDQVEGRRTLSHDRLTVAQLLGVLRSDLANVFLGSKYSFKSLCCRCCRCNTLSSRALSYFFMSLMPLRLELAESQTYFVALLTFSVHIASHIALLLCTILAQLRTNVKKCKHLSCFVLLVALGWIGHLAALTDVDGHLFGPDPALK